MKKVFCIVLCLVTLLCVTSAFASEKLDAYTEALKSKTWEMKGATLVNTSVAAPNLTLVGAYFTKISLTNSSIQLFEDADGKIYITFSKSPIGGGNFDDLAVAEIIFNDNMTAFILLSDGCADLYK